MYVHPSTNPTNMNGRDPVKTKKKVLPFNPMYVENPINFFKKSNQLIGA